MSEAASKYTAKYDETMRRLIGERLAVIAGRGRALRVVQPEGAGRAGRRRSPRGAGREAHVESAGGHYARVEAEAALQ